MLFLSSHRRLLEETVSSKLGAVLERLAPREEEVRISTHTAELLDLYAQASGEELGVTLTRAQAVERLVQVFIGNSLAAKEVRRAEVLRG